MANTQLEKYRRIAKTLKNPTPVELPSGKFRCQVTVDGHRESVVDEDPRVAHAQALAIKARLLEAVKKPKDMTVGEAIDRYIESKDSVLSPSTNGALLYRASPVYALISGLRAAAMRRLASETPRCGSACEANSPDTRMSGLFCVTAFRTRECLPCDACGIYPSALCGGYNLLMQTVPAAKTGNPIPPARPSTENVGGLFHPIHPIKKEVMYYAETENHPGTESRGL